MKQTFFSAAMIFRAISMKQFDISDCQRRRAIDPTR
jgi:hypothetical protein